MWCKGCQAKVEGEFAPHCGGNCRWVVCPSCKATVDTVSDDPEAFFAKPKKSPKQAG